MSETYQERVDAALSYDELESLKPSSDELFENTWRATKWYNEAVWTAAALFVEAAEESETFRERFLSGETKEVPAFPSEDDSKSVEMEVWRSTLEKEVPEIHEKVMGIGLSAFQGGSAENVALEILRDETEDLSNNDSNN